MKYSFAYCTVAFIVLPYLIQADVSSTNVRATSEQQQRRDLLSIGDIPQVVYEYWTSLFSNPQSPETKYSPSIDQEDDGYAYILVKVTSGNGRDFLFSLPEVMVDNEFPVDGFLAIRVANEDLDYVVEKLEEHPDIDSYEEDSLYTEQGTLDAYLTEDEVRRQLKSTSRQLNEVVPYGISMTQGDQVTIGYRPVQVCIVDTGVARGHPDLDFVRLLRGANRTSYVDSSRLVWSGDTRGHGTHVSVINDKFV